MTRFVVTEVEGYRTAKISGGAVPGLSVHVIYTAYAHRVHLLLTSEEHSWRGRGAARAHIRERAAQLAQQLNEVAA